MSSQVIQVESIKNDYLNWVKENNHFKLHTNNVVEIATPFTDNFGDNINLIIKQEGNKFRISDDSYFVWNLEAHGLNVTKKNSRRNHLLKSILSFETVHLDEATNEIYKLASPKKVGQGIHEVIQALNRVSDLMLLNQSNVKSLFSEDVFAYLKEHKDIYDYFLDFQIVGQSKLAFNFDALFTTKDRSKKIVKIYNSFTKTNVENALLSWLDTVPYRLEHHDSKLSMALIVNDEDNKNFSQDYLDALSEYDIQVLPFSDKDLLKKELSLVG